ncbi:YdcF family protein [Lysobacter sp. S4-A87]|uniref:YdcF family protein n=1 Tax=Lysobacter sp. S4-A87 TaxID=2925843 RepID=UPI001F52C4B6|nr:YdcF family protein [Lysobacter sp. S4-A87]UNK49952.1 YdcF family protein [Lysobacter sp. S4-A87]
MSQTLQKLVVGLTYPPALSLCLMAIAAGLLFLRHRRIAATLLAVAIAWSGLWSVPMASDWLRGKLEARYPPVDEATLPSADAIVVLGGGMRYGWLDRPEVRAEDLENSRLAAGARAWLARRAPIVILSGGGENGGTGSHGSEARMMATAITRLGVPTSALLLEERSRNTRDNAQFTAQIAQARGAHRILLVTSSLHMPRAIEQFRGEGIDAIAVAVPERARRISWKERWFPSRSALWRSGRAFKEFGGLLMIRIQN